jgi:hypothetical protein
VVTVTQRVDTRLLLSGEQAEVTMRIEPYCPIHESFLHVVLALPATDALPARDRAAVRDDVYALIDKILESKDRICCGRRVERPRIGIATYNSRGYMPCQLMDDADRLKRCADRIMQSRPGNDLGLGLRSAQGILQRGRAPDVLAYEILIVVAGGESEDRCQSLVRAAGSIKSQGVTLLAACASSEACDVACLRQLPSSARYLYSRTKLILPIFEPERCECINISLRQLQWSTTLVPGLAYVEESTSLPVEPRDADAPLTWSQNFIPKQGLTLTYRVRPNWLGFRQIELGSEVSFRDNQNRAGAASSTSTLGLAVFRPFRLDP